MGVIADAITYFVLFLLLASYVGATVFAAAQADVKAELYRTSTHAVALEISNLISITDIATGNIHINYQVDRDIEHIISTENHVVTVARKEENLPEEKFQKFKFSVPFEIGKIRQSGTRFLISQENGIHRIGREAK